MDPITIILTLAGLIVALVFGILQVGIGRKQLRLSLKTDERGFLTSTDKDEVPRKTTELSKDLKENNGTDRIAGPLLGTVAQFFQNRCKELRELKLQLLNQELRLLLVCGRPGVGKTALITKFIHDLKNDDFYLDEPKTISIDSIVYITLRQSEDRSPDKIVDLLAKTLTPMASRELQDKWKGESTLNTKLEFLFRDTLAHHRCLIVLDNLENILDAENQIHKDYDDLKQFIEKCIELDHSAQLVITSRRTMVFRTDLEGCIGKRRVELSLDDGLPEPDAIKLLRKLDTDGSLGIQNSDYEPLVKAVKQCYNIPRTLEILVGTIRQRRTWTLSKLFDNPETLSLLSANPARELHESLSSEEKLVVQALSVYDRPVPSDAVHHILPRHPVDDIIDALIKNYVITCDYRNKHVSLHPLDRSYAYRLIPDAETNNTKPVFHLLAAEFFGSQEKPQSEWKGIEDIDAHLQEIHHLVLAKHYDDACTILNIIDREHLAVWGNYALIIELRIALVGQIKDRYLNSINLGNLGCAYLESGAPDKSVSYYEEALTIACELSDKAESRWLGNLGVAHLSLGHIEKARDYFEQALALAKEIGDRKHQGRWLGKLAHFQLRDGKAPNAIQAYHEAIEIAREEKDIRFEQYWLAALGSIHASSGETHEAIRFFEDASDRSERIGDQKRRYEYLLNLAACFANLGNKPKEKECYERAITIARNYGDAVAEGNSLVSLAECFFNMGNVPESIIHYESAVSIASALGDKLAERNFLRRLGLIAISNGNAEQAIQYYDKALEIIPDVEDDPTEIDLLIKLGSSSYYLGDHNKSIMYYNLALSSARKIGNREFESIALYNIGDANHLGGNLSEAEHYYQESLTIDEIATNYKCALGLGMVYLQQGAGKKARKYFNRCATICNHFLEQNYRFHPESSALSLALLGMGKSKEALLILHQGIERGVSVDGLHYTLQDLLVLKRCKESLLGLEEAIELIKKALA